MSTVKSKKLQVGTDASASNNFTIYQPATPDGTLRIGVGNADSPTEVGRFDSNGYVATNAPLFRAYIGSTQSISNTTFTKVNFNTTVYDTTSDFDTSNYRFVPSVSGYYHVHGAIRYDGSTDGKVLVSQIYKNGSNNVAFEGASNGTDSSTQMSVVVYMNGTTDYLEFYTYHNYGVATNIFSGSTLGVFEAHLIQQA